MTGESREARLAEALKNLRNECRAIEAMSYDEIKQSAGYTNLKVWLGRLDEADAALQESAGEPHSGATGEAAPVASEPSEDLRKWERAAFLKDRTRREIRGRAGKHGEDAASLAEDFDVPVEFVQFLLASQLFPDDESLGLPAPVSPVEPDPCVWRPIETADRSAAALHRRILGFVDGHVRVIAWGYTSHTKWLTWCLADQGVEDYDGCHPTHWMPLPAAPLVVEPKAGEEKPT